MTLRQRIALENRNLDVSFIFVLTLSLVSSNDWVTHLYRGSCTLSFIYFKSFLYTEALYYCVLFCLTHRRADILSANQAQLHVCLKDYPISFVCTHCDCHNRKLESDTPFISVSSAWHSESGHQRHWSPGEWRRRWQRSQHLADGRVSSWYNVFVAYRLACVVIQCNVCQIAPKALKCTVAETTYADFLKCSSSYTASIRNNDTYYSFKIELKSQLKDNQLCDHILWPAEVTWSELYLFNVLCILVSTLKCFMCSCEVYSVFVLVLMCF